MTDYSYHPACPLAVPELASRFVDIVWSVNDSSCVILKRHASGETAEAATLEPSSLSLSWYGLLGVHSEKQGAGKEVGEGRRRQWSIVESACRRSLEMNVTFVSQWLTASIDVAAKHKTLERPEIQISATIKHFQSHPKER